MNSRTRSLRQPARLAPRIALLTGGALLALSGCSKPFDIDLRRLGKGFSTTEAVANLAPRPQPDSRGVISYPNYQVAVAQRGDTVASVAARLGVDQGALARYNAIAPDTVLRPGEVLALPSRVSTAPGVTSQPIGADPNLASGAEPLRHTVRQGETAYSIARLYDVPIGALKEWNGLGDDMAVRNGQTLLIPVAGAAAPVATTAPAPAAPAVTAPGEGSSTPTPPSSVTPLPASSPAPAASAAASSRPAATPTPAPQPKPETTQASAAGSARLVRPVAGSIIRDYAKGRNDGIDISASAGTAVKAADAGTVAAVTENTNGAKIVVIKHSGDLLTVYVNVTDLTISKGGSVSRGQTIAKVAAGDPPALHFEVRRGLESADPNDYLP
ncbi:MAG: peptidase M23 [Rhodobacterales bacterium]|nr:MAG: peptidase M23 [Rhodobacterales bacterium]